MTDTKSALEDFKYYHLHRRRSGATFVLSDKTAETICTALLEVDGLKEKLRRIEDDDTALEKILAMTDEQTRALYAERGECAECAATKSKATIKNAMSYFHQRAAELELEKAKAQLEANAAHIGDLLDVNEENARLKAEIAVLKEKCK